MRAVLQDDPTFSERLRDSVSRTYALFLGRSVEIVLNGSKVRPWDLSLGDSDELRAGHEELTCDGVSVHLFAGLGPPDERGKWEAGSAGWYVACNGRLVVVADQSALTGWGHDPMPRFHEGKFRRFRGVALLSAEDPLELPWTTSKRGLNQESGVYQSVRNRMAQVAAPVIAFLNRMYPSDPAEAAAERDMAARVTALPVRALAARPATAFRVPPKPARAPKSTVRVQYDAERAHIEAIKRHLKQPDISAVRIGELTLKYYLRNEGLE